MAGADVIACASSEKKLAQLKELGADHLIDYKQQEASREGHRRASDGKPHRRKFEGGVDVAVKFTGGETWVPTLKVVHRRRPYPHMLRHGGFFELEGASALYLELRAASAGLERLDAATTWASP